MTMHKEEVLELVHQLPDEVDLEEVIYCLYLREKLAAAEADITPGGLFRLKKCGHRCARGGSKMDATRRGTPLSLTTTGRPEDNTRHRKT